MVRRAGITSGLTIALIAVLAASALAEAGPRPALSPTPNASIALYKPSANGKSGTLRTGIIKAGGYIQKQVTKTGSWSAMAAGRDSLALYDKRSGRLLVGTLRDGRFRSKQEHRIGKGFTHAASSCDSLLLYREGTGVAQTGELTLGAYRDPRMAGMRAGFRIVEGSCRVLLLNGPTPPRTETRWLQDGHLAGSDSYHEGEYTFVGQNRTSFLIFYAPSTGQWGRWSGTFPDAEGGASSFSADWDIIEGAGDWMVFYDRDSGVAAVWSLIDGQPGSETVTDLGRGVRLIAGGR